MSVRSERPDWALNRPKWSARRRPVKRGPSDSLLARRLLMGKRHSQGGSEMSASKENWKHWITGALVAIAAIALMASVGAAHAGSEHATAGAASQSLPPECAAARAAGWRRLEADAAGQSRCLQRALAPIVSATRRDEVSDHFAGGPVELTQGWRGEAPCPQHWLQY